MGGQVKVRILNPYYPPNRVKGWYYVEPVEWIPKNIRLGAFRGSVYQDANGTTVARMVGNVAWQRGDTREIPDGGDCD